MKPGNLIATGLPPGTGAGRDTTPNDPDDPYGLLALCPASTEWLPRMAIDERSGSEQPARIAANRQREHSRRPRGYAVDILTGLGRGKRHAASMPCRMTA